MPAPQAPVAQAPVAQAPVYPQPQMGQVPLAPQQAPRKSNKALIAALLVIVFIVAVGAGLLLAHLLQDKEPTMEESFSDPAFRKALIVYDEDEDGNLSKDEAARVYNIKIDVDVHVVDGLQRLPNLESIDTGERTSEWRLADDLPKSGDKDAPDLIIVVPVPDNEKTKDWDKNDKQTYDNLIKDITFKVKPEPTLPRRLKSADEQKSPSVQKDEIAAEFVRVWYDDWTFENGQNVNNEKDVVVRCEPYIAEDTELYDEFVNSAPGEGKYFRNFASCVLEDPTVEDMGDDIYRVTIRFGGTQIYVDQERYDEILANPIESVWNVTVNDEGKVTALEEVSTTGGGESPSDGREADNTVHFTGADFVLPEAWWGEVEPVLGQANMSGESIVHNGCALLTWDPDGAEFYDEWRANGQQPIDYRDVSTETLPDGTELIFGEGNDTICQVEITDPQGNKGILWTFAAPDFLGAVDADVAAEHLRLKAAAAGVSEDGDPYDIAFAYLRACAERMTLQS